MRKPALAILGACLHLFACSSTRAVPSNSQTAGMPSAPAPVVSGSAGVTAQLPAAVAGNRPAAPSAPMSVAGGAGTSPAHAGAAALAGASGSLAAGSGGTAAGAGASGAPSAGATAAKSGTSTLPAAKGCEDTKLLAVPDDPGAPGPWPVGAKTVQLKTSGGMETLEVWYPGQLGSEQGMKPAIYDLSLTIPPSDRMKIPAAENAPQPCDCYRDLPIDKTHGPYPPVIFVHGLASFRTASLTTMTQWASRGFIVLAADHLGEWLLDFTSGLCGGGGSGAAGDFNGDVDAELAALKAASGELAFLADSLDMSRVAIGGHSMGAGTVASASTKPNVQLVILLAELGGAPVSASSSLKSVLVMGGMVDTVTQWSADQSAYAGSPSPKRLVGITAGDHLDVTDICSQTNAAGETSIDVGTRNGVCALGIVNGLAHCGSMKDRKQGPGIVSYVSTAVLEQTLHCTDRSAALADDVVKAKFSAIGVYEHQP